MWFKPASSLTRLDLSWYILGDSEPNTLHMTALLEMAEALALNHLPTGQVGGPEADE